eukprot:g2049.t1
MSTPEQDPSNFGGVEDATSAPANHNALLSQAISNATPTHQYDLIQQVAQYIDPHMVLIILDHLLKLGMYEPADLLKARKDLLDNTYLYDYAIETYQELNKTSEEPQDLVQAKQNFLDNIANIDAQVAPLLAIIEEEGETLLAEENFTLEYMSKTHGVTAEMVEQLYYYARVLFDCAKYTKSQNLLKHYRLLTGPNSEKSLWCLWGILACEIIEATGGYETALGCLNQLREAIDSQPMAHLEQLQQRTWLIHWSLFVFFNFFEESRDDMVKFMFNDKHLNAIQMNCPWIIR